MHPAFALQYERPDGISSGSWASGSYTEIDETVQNNADYIQSSKLGKRGTNVVTFTISDVTDPNLSTDHIIRYAYKEDALGSNSPSLTVTLLQGTQKIASWDEKTLSSSFTLSTQTLASNQANAITDYADLRLEFTATCSAKCSDNITNMDSVSVSWVEFEVPDIISATSGSATSGSSSRPPPRIDGIGLYKIIMQPDQGDVADSQKFEDYFPYSMHSYESDYENYGEKFVKVGQFFPLNGYSTDVLPVIAAKGDHVQFQVRLIDQYRGANIEHVALYSTDEESTGIENLDTFVSYEKYGPVTISDPRGIFLSVKVVTSSEFDAYWAIFDIQFAKSISSKGMLIETWNESHFPAYAKVKNTIEVNDPALKQVEDVPILKIAEISIPFTHTSPQCVSKKACFDPSESTILKGGIVSWINNDASFFHAITSGNPESGPDNRFNGFLRPMSTYEFQFNQIGDYAYYCAIHPWSTGMIYVVDQDTQSSFDKIGDMTSGSNISGKVTITESVKVPIRVESVASGVVTTIESGKTVFVESHDLSVRISGNIEGHPKSKHVEITIIHPDGSESQLTALANGRGEYSVPTKFEMAERNL